MIEMLRCGPPSAVHMANGGDRPYLYKVAAYIAKLRTGDERSVTRYDRRRPTEPPARTKMVPPAWSQCPLIPNWLANNYVRKDGRSWMVATNGVS
jgi:hypothetical protein